MSLNKVKIELTHRQVELLLEYTYPFEFEEKQLKRFKAGRKDFYVLKSDDFYAPMLVGDIVYSSKKINDAWLLEELFELADIIEISVSGGFL